MRCEHCGTEFPFNVGGSYDVQACRARCLEKKIADLQQLRAQVELDMLNAGSVLMVDELELALRSCDRQLLVYRRDLERARYVGD